MPVELLPVVTDVSGLGGSWAAAVCFSFAAHVVLVSFLRLAEPTDTGLLAGSVIWEFREGSASMVSCFGAPLMKLTSNSRRADTDETARRR